MQFQKIKTFVDRVKRSGISGLDFESKDLKISIEKPLGVPVENISTKAEIQPVVASDDVKIIDELKQYFTADRVGVFYLNAKSSDPTFVAEGQLVKTGDPLCIIKAMNIRHTLNAPFDFLITKILVQENNPVEYGEHLFEIKPA